jgi:hypothetical protein
MTILFGVILVLHLIGWAIVLGGALVNLRSGAVVTGMLHGALTALLTGLILAVLAGAGAAGDDGPVNWTKLLVKLAVALVVCAVVWWGGRKEKAGTPVVATIGALTALNVAIAVLWR